MNLPKCLSLVFISCLFSAALSAEIRGQSFADEAGDKQKAFYINTDKVKRLFADGDLEEARSLAQRLIGDAEEFPKDWNYGNAIHAANIVLGRIALREDDTKLAGKYLLSAGGTPGSPQLDTFGPDMNLARELIAAGEPDTVVAYFDLCEKFWKMNDGRLKAWRESVKLGKIPDFGANLRYFSGEPVQNQ
jgi:hypothetical protein